MFGWLRRKLGKKLLVVVFTTIIVPGLYTILVDQSGMTPDMAKEVILALAGLVGISLAGHAWVDAKVTGAIKDKESYEVALQVQRQQHMNQMEMQREAAAAQLLAQRGAGHVTRPPMAEVPPVGNPGEPPPPRTG